MLVKRFNPITKSHYSINLDIDEDKYIQYIDGKGLIQNMLPNLNSDEREFIISGCLPGFFEAQFSNFHKYEIVCYQYDILVFYVPEFNKFYIYLIKDGTIENNFIVDFNYNLYTNKFDLFFQNIDEVVKFTIVTFLQKEIERNLLLRIDIINSVIKQRITEFMISNNGDNLNETQNNDIITFCNNLK